MSHTTGHPTTLQHTTLHAAHPHIHYRTAASAGGQHSTAQRNSAQNCPGCRAPSWNCPTVRPQQAAVTAASFARIQCTLCHTRQGKAVDSLRGPLPPHGSALANPNTASQFDSPAPLSSHVSPTPNHISIERQPNTQHTYTPCHPRLLEACAVRDSKCVCSLPGSAFTPRLAHTMIVNVLINMTAQQGLGFRASPQTLGLNPKPWVQQQLPDSACWLVVCHPSPCMGASHHVHCTNGRMCTTLTTTQLSDPCHQQSPNSPVEGCVWCHTPPSPSQHEQQPASCTNLPGSITPPTGR